MAGGGHPYCRCGLCPRCARLGYKAAATAMAPNAAPEANPPPAPAASPPPAPEANPPPAPDAMNPRPALERRACIGVFPAIPPNADARLVIERFNVIGNGLYHKSCRGLLDAGVTALRCEWCQRKMHNAGRELERIGVFGMVEELTISNSSLVQDIRRLMATLAINPEDPDAIASLNMLARVALAGRFALDAGRVVERKIAFYVCPGIGHDDAGLADARQLCELASETVVIAENGRLRGAACAHWQLVAKNAFASPLCKVCRPALVKLQKKIATRNEMHEQVTDPSSKTAYQHLSRDQLQERLRHAMTKLKQQERQKIAASGGKRPAVDTRSPPTTAKKPHTVLPINPAITRWI
ncbi:hypothetical protein, variant [Saprolegnia diclina VS20]|uniref:Uncharacterized protein n=1 Tax=Saprolegnia diclina (strain VS20) TaxID=1156394 RepID=T0PTE5_SAPDV|nr:hypothetical protein, variant [Saprolegnia diclina VS20]EQC28789.1 hypothetical protein, variant [Saprolegnia diclina VS20]|eukprot:XP_008617784.1 hypothetical protein, variant [Saprolegnia diclina VS20]